MPVRCPSCARVVPEETGYCSRCGSSLIVPLRLNWLARLFWSCPSCGSETSLTVNQPFFGEATLGCGACNALWRLDAEARALTQVNRDTKRPMETRPVDDWLALLTPPLSWRSLPAPRLLLAPGETCLVRVERARMLTPRQSVQRRQPIGRVEVAPGIYERVANDPLGPSPQQLSTLARGPFFVTDRRVVFMGDRKHVEAPLQRLDGIEVDEGFLLIHRPARTDTFGFSDENAVKVRAAILIIRAQIQHEAEEAESTPARDTRQPQPDGEEIIPVNTAAPAAGTPLARLDDEDRDSN